MKTQRLSTQSKLFISLFVVAVLFVSSMLIPIPFILNSREVHRTFKTRLAWMVKKYRAGAYLMTTVSVQEATPQRIY